MEIRPSITKRQVAKTAAARRHPAAAAHPVRARLLHVSNSSNSMALTCKVNGKLRFFIFAASSTRTRRCRSLHDAGFNTLFFDYPWDPYEIKQMTDLDFMLVPKSARNLKRRSFGLSGHFDARRGAWVFRPGQCADVEYRHRGFIMRQTSLVSRVAPGHQSGGPCASPRPSTPGTASTVIRLTPENPGLVSVHRWPLMTTLELTQYKDWLQGRSRLAKPGTFMWTWIQTHIARLFHANALIRSPRRRPSPEPIGPPTRTGC